MVDSALITGNPRRGTLQHAIGASGSSLAAQIAILYVQKVSVPMLARRHRKLIALTALAILCVVAWHCYRKHLNNTAIRSIERAGGVVRDEVSYPSWLPENTLPNFAYAPFKRVSSSVQISNRPVVDTDLAAINDLANVTWMELHTTSVKGSGLAAISNQSNLRRLFLNNNPITDSGLAHLQGLENLQWLELGETMISDAGLMYLSRLHRLERLGLVNTRITDAGLQYLQPLTSLTKLELYGTDITDASIPILSRMKSLSEVHLHNTKVSDEGAAALQMALPSCTIAR